jgi:hypothetical protein
MNYFGTDDVNIDDVINQLQLEQNFYAQTITPSGNVNLNLSSSVIVVDVPSTVSTTITLTLPNGTTTGQKINILRNDVSSATVNLSYAGGSNSLTTGNAQNLLLTWGGSSWS